MTQTLRNMATALALVCAVSVHGAGLDLRLESDVREKLPALPIPLRVVAVNGGDSEVALPGTVFLHASRDGAEMFLGGNVTGWEKQPAVADEDLEPDWDPRLRLAPGGTITAEFPVRYDCADPAFFLNAFLWTPGVYQLRVLASPHIDRLADAVRGDRLSEVIESVPDLTVSQPLTIEVREPAGADAEAWNYFRQQTEGNHWLYGGASGDDALIVQTLNDRYPTSHYALCFGASKTREQSLAQLEALAARLRAAPQPQFMLDWIELTIARHHRSQCWGHLHPPRNVAAAADECEKSYERLRQLLTSAKNPMVVEMAQKDLASASRRQDIYEFAAKLDGSDGAARVRPFVACSKETGNELEVTFGYENPADVSVTLPIGTANRFAPAPENRGQPTTFLPGRHPDAFTLRVKGKKNDPARSVSWTLNGVTVAPAKSDPKCKK